MHIYGESIYGEPVSIGASWEIISEISTAIFDPAQIGSILSWAGSVDDLQSSMIASLFDRHIIASAINHEEQDREFLNAKTSITSNVFITSLVTISINDD